MSEVSSVKKPERDGLEVVYLNERIEMFDAAYDEERRLQYDLLPRIYNPILGPVTTLNLYRPELLDLSMYGTSCRHVPVGSLLRDLLVKGPSADTQAIASGGKGASMQQALLGNLGEAAERLLAALHSATVLDTAVFATHQQLVSEGRRALGPAEIPLFAPEQYMDPDFGYVPFREDTPLSWIEGEDLLNGERVLVPAQLTLFYWQRHPAEGRIGYATSGGLVFHTDRRHAILHGLYEAAERDAVNLRWYCRIPPVRVEVDVDEFLRAHLNQPYPRTSTPYIAPVQVLLNTLDVPIPVFTAITVDRSRRDRAFLAGGGAWIRRERALSQALFEIGQMRTGYTLFGSTWDHIRADTPLSALTDFYFAPVYYGYVENLPRVAWYMTGPESIEWDDVITSTAQDEAEEYVVMMDHLRALDLHPILLDFSTACWPGVSITKVFMPGLTQAHIPSAPFLGHPRYYELPQRMGLAGRRLQFSELMVDPLPFP